MSAEKIREYISSVIVILVATLLSLLPVPIIGLFGSAIAIAVLGFITTRFHYKYVIAAILNAFVMQSIFSANILSALLSMLPFILCGLTFGIGYNIKCAPLKSIALATVSYVLYLVANLKLYSLATNGSNIFEEALSSAAKMYEEAFISASGAQIAPEEIHEMIITLTNTVMRYIPSMLVIVCIVFALFSFYLFKRICKMRKCDVERIPAFSEWRSEKSVSIIYFVLFAVSAFLPFEAVWMDALMNVVMVMTFVFYLFGLSLLEYLLEKHIPKSFVRKIILLAISAVSLFMNIPFFILSLLGAMDSFINYRQKKPFSR